MIIAVIWAVMTLAIYGMIEEEVDHPGARFLWSLMWPIVLFGNFLKGIFVVFSDLADACRWHY